MTGIAACARAANGKAAAPAATERNSRRFMVNAPGSPIS
jgi:hypothetical protein